MTQLSPGAALAGPTAPPHAAGVDNPRNGVFADLAEIWRDLVAHRDLLYQLTRRDVRIRYKQAVMGFGWAIFMPILIVAAGVLVRVALAGATGSDVERASIAALSVKALPWAFFVGSLGFAAASLTGNMNLVGKIYFPREVLPLSATLAQGFDMLIGACAVALLLPFLGVGLSSALVWVPVLVMLLFVFTAAVNLFVSCANLFFRDVKYIVQVLLTFGIFFTPVLFDVTMMGPQSAPLVMLNPLAPILEGLRLAIVEGHDLLQPLVVTTAEGVSFVAWSPWHLAYSAAVGVGGFAASAVFFHRLEFLFAEYI